ncbi:MAG: exodeoxyribonuclease V subunit gamma [Chthoniobacterales bacterium]|nr:exodeoxyribonuclease V subunit gamma [Chthoniobacterales bacterium]
MPGLYLHTSNRLENLFADLARIIAHPSGSIFQPETIVVQSIGMGRWLSLRLAEAHGICANVQFPFPQKFVAEIFREVLPDTPPTEAFERDLLPWRIMRVLPALLDRPEFRPVQHYLVGARPELKLYQLSYKIAEVFDRYLAFRPRMVLDWDGGKGKDWQAILWRELAKGETHQPMLAQELAAKMRGKLQAITLPSRVFIFGISTLPEFYLGIVQALAAQIEIHLFVMEPTPHWWREIVSGREVAGILRRQPERTAAELHLDQGNSLLASMGKLGKDFLGLIGDLEPAAHLESFAEPSEHTLLAQVQRDIFLLENRELPCAPKSNENSIQFHSCHSPMREMEVLHDQLLDIFRAHPVLQPKDFVVMMPDVAAYAPYIEAVFGTAENESLRIPFTIADRTTRAENGVADTFLGLLELTGSRFGASSVLNILESPAVLRRFDLAETDLETIRVWLDKAAIRWGIDAEHRVDFDVPAFGQNSWREGLDRLLLGYAMPTGGQNLFHGLLPIDEIEGGLAETLGNFIEFADALFRTATEMKPARSLTEWQTILRRIVERFFAPSGEVERDLLQLRRVLDSLGDISRDAAFDGPLSFDVLLAHLHRVLQDADAGLGFLVGRVTFCALKPMRSIPFPVVCLIGMNDTAYPRHSPAIGFDLMAQHPRPGDRSMRDDDRYVFLEALLSARTMLYVSYVGQSLKDNSRLPPSVLVSELLDYLGDSEKNSLVTQHRLQPFSEDYFRKDSALFSYSADNCRASEVARQPRREPPPFLSQPLPEPEEEWRIVDLETLAAFYRNPAQFFIQRRLGLKFPNERPQLEEREPFDLAPLIKYKVEDELLRKQLGGVLLAEEEELIRASGQFPPGHPGARRYREISQGVEEFAALVGDKVSGKLLDPFPINLELGPWRLTGLVDELTTNGLVRYRLTKLKAKEMLRVWLFHLALNASRSPTNSVLIGQDIFQTFSPVAKSRELLQDLLEIYWQGLSEPLLFFPQSSYAFARQSLSARAKAEPINKARAVWESGFRHRGEMEDSYFQLAFRHLADPLNEKMQELSLRVFRPLISARLERKVK